jgi:hypothetical protein
MLDDRVIAVQNQLLRLFELSPDIVKLL